MELFFVPIVELSSEANIAVVVGTKHIPVKVRHKAYLIIYIIMSEPKISSQTINPTAGYIRRLKKNAENDANNQLPERFKKVRFQSLP